VSFAASGVPVRRLWLAVFCGYLTLGATLQALPAFVPARFGGGPVASGAAVGVAFLATACTRPFAGLLADAGRARPVVMLGGTLGALGGLGHLLAPDYTVLLIARLLMGAGEAALFSGALPWVLTAAPADRRGRVAGWFGLSMWGGLAAGPLLATGLTAAGGFRAVWYAVVALAATSAVLVATTRGQSDAPRQALTWPRRWRDIVPRGASLPGLAFGFASYGYGTLAALLVLYLRHASIGADGYALAVFAAAFLLTRTLGSPLVDKLGGATVGAVSVLVEALGLLLVATAAAQPPVLLGVTLTGAGVALMYPATVAMTLRRTGALRPGTSVGVMTSFWDLGIMVAGPVGGAIASAGGYPVAFLVAVLTSVASLTVITVLRHSRTVAGPVPAPAATSASSRS
jgi:MFS family permease